MFGKLPDAYTQHPTYLRLFSGFVRFASASSIMSLTPLDREFLKLARLPCPEWTIKRSDPCPVGRYEHPFCIHDVSLTLE
jgi:hypothetical protein